ncbi:uncharacterized protein LOC133904644 [Phragmites australis]|uniref:uncharacterized protein LOC133904644 n=1 Tax=Phragmites australis TaxID=29695 RepID=UPI002D78DCE8|nr:uncharacterized protein LOC133904644 [Phragmites australis]
MAAHHCTRPMFLLLVFAATTFAARDLDGANPLPSPARLAPYYGYGAIPGIPPGGFYGGFGVPGGGYAHSSVEVPTVVCQEKGPRYGKRVACPKKCFWSYSRSGNGYGAGGPSTARPSAPPTADPLLVTYFPFDELYVYYTFVACMHVCHET